MPLVQAWQCPETKTLFADKESYLKHLRVRGAMRLSAFKDRKVQENFHSYIQTLTKADSFETISRWVIENDEILLRYNDNGRRRNDEYRAKKKLKPLLHRSPRIRNVLFNRMTWSERCSNTHCAPKGKPQNWGHDPDLPSGYPGWVGWLYFTIEFDRHYSGNPFEGTPIHTGSGGGKAIYDEHGTACGSRYGYSVTLFDEEWPLLRLMMKMRGEI